MSSKIELWIRELHGGGVAYKRDPRPFRFAWTFPWWLDYFQRISTPCVYLVKTWHFDIYSDQYSGHIMRHNAARIMRHNRLLWTLPSLWLHYEIQFAGWSIFEKERSILEGACVQNFCFRYWWIFSDLHFWIKWVDIYDSHYGEEPDLVRQL